LLQSALPGIDLDDPKFDARGVEQLIENNRARLQARQAAAVPKHDEDGEIEPMVDRVGLLDLDDQGRWDFHGHSSGYAFMRKFRSQFGEQFLPISNPKLASRTRNISSILESPRSAMSSPFEGTLPTTVDLPSKEAAIELCRATLDDCCALMRPLHRPTFFRRLHAIYATEPEQYTNEHMKFLPLLYVVLGVGFLFAQTDNENSMLEIKDYSEAIEQGYRYLDASKQMLDITDCRDLITIQTVFFMILFLQSSAKLATCYAYIGIGLRACCRLGLHRSLPADKFSPIEQEERKRIFWLIRKIDTYVGGMLGLPQMLSDEDIDQELPTEVDDECITEDGIKQMPTRAFSLMKATNAHTRLTFIYRKVVRYIYPLKGSESAPLSTNYTISHARIRELEQDLQVWMDQLPVELRPSDNVAIELSRVQQLLRMSYAHVQMMMYRPFIHYVTQASQIEKADKRSFACAAACVSVARNIVHITSEMKRRGLLVGAYWFVMYTTFFAIISLVYFVLENPNSPTCADILKDALEGRETLASLAQRSMAADRCSESLVSLFKELPEKLQERRNSSVPPTTGRKRPAPSADNQSTPNIAPSRDASMTPGRARTLPHDYLAKIAKRNSMPEPTNSEKGHAMPNPHLVNLNSPVVSSPLSQQFEYPTPQMGPSQIPDLKNVMFPSDNPFAYPNQPISTLETADARFGYPDPNSLDSPFAGSNENSMLGTPASIPSQPQIPMTSHPEQGAQQGHMDLAMMQRMFEENPQMAAQFVQQQRAAFGGQGGSMHHQFPQGGGPPGHQIMPLPAAPLQEDYWSHVNKGGIPTRSGYTPGGTVNLDELFGGGDGWGPSGMWETQGFPRQ
jgi:hypothetical protein